MNACTNLKDQEWNISGNATPIELIGMEFLGKLDSRKTRGFPSVVNLASAQNGVKRKQVWLRLVFAQERGIVNATFTSCEGSRDRHTVLRSQQQELLEVSFPNSPGGCPQLWRR